MQLHQQYKDQGLDVITLNMEGEEGLEQAKAVVQRLELPLANFSLAEGVSDAGLAAVQKEDGALPALHFYDRKGRLRYHLEGLIDHDEVERYLGELLKEE